MAEAAAEIPEDIREMSFEDALAELEGIVQRLEQGKGALEDSIHAYERGSALRRHCEEATVWKLAAGEGYLGALLTQGFAPPVLLAIADGLRDALPRVIGDLPLLQAWGFKYDQRLQGINMHADFARVNLNFR